MRILLHSLLFAVLLLINNVAHTQCTISNPGIKLNYTTPNLTTGGCDINFDLYFDMEANAGGKFVYVHIWPRSIYPTLTYSNPPNLTDLGNSVATMGFYHFSGSLYMLNSYTPFPTVPNFKFAGLSIIKGTGSFAGSERFTIRNITITGLSTCNVAQAFTADVWQSQSSSAQKVHCFSRGLRFVANDPRITGFLNCSVPRTYQFQIKTIEPSGLTVSYKAYIDDGDGVYNAANDTIHISSGTNIELNSGNEFTYNSPVLEYLPYSNRKPEADRAIWIVVTSPTRDNGSLARLDNNCTALPVLFGSFTAKWVNQQAQLEWTTLTEIENKGFEIERKNKDDDQPFRPIGFKPSQAHMGNSSSSLTYVFHDPTPINVPVLYRLKQIDYSGKFGYSIIRSLQIPRILSQASPNPADKELTLIFAEKQNNFLIECINYLGQRVGQWNARDRISIPTHSLPSGTYGIRIIDQKTGESEVKTVLIQHMQ